MKKRRPVNRIRDGIKAHGEQSAERSRREADAEFWNIAAEEISQGEEVTVCKAGHVITCTTLAELWAARAEFEGV